MDRAALQVCGPLDLQGERMSIPEKILQAGCDAYAATFLNGNGSLGDGIEAAYFAIHEHDDWVRAGPPAWTGEGLPPVGTVCEMRRTDYVDVDWQRIEFLCAGSKKAFFRDREGHEWSRPLGDLKFRPIRTPEQIAAEERRAAIKEMIGHIGGSRRCEAEVLYDAGYRKQVSE